MSNRLPATYRPAIQFEIAFDETCLDAHLPKPVSEYTDEEDLNCDRCEVWDDHNEEWVKAYDHKARRWTNLNLDAKQVEFGDVIHVNNTHVVWTQGGWLFADYFDVPDPIMPYGQYLFAGNGTPFPFNHWKNTDLRGSCRASPGYLADVAFACVKRFGSVDAFKADALYKDPLVFTVDDHGKEVTFKISESYWKTVHELLHGMATHIEYTDSRMWCRVDEDEEGRVTITHS